MSDFEVAVSDGAIGTKAGYIYVIAVPRHRVLYIGQTRNALGAIGRLAQHISQSAGSTLRSRVARHLGFESVDLGRSYGVDFPLYAAFSHGGNLIPLFWKSELDNAGQEIVKTVLDANGIVNLPERHPVL